MQCCAQYTEDNHTLLGLEWGGLWILHHEDDLGISILQRAGVQSSVLETDVLGWVVQLSDRVLACTFEA